MSASWILQQQKSYGQAETAKMSGKSAEILEFEEQSIIHASMRHPITFDNLQRSEDPRGD
jgi:hypothetical protein